MQLTRLTLRQLRVFVAVARTGSATAAGQEIGLSQSATSSAVQELEAALGVALFDRIGKRMVPNDIARALQARAQALLVEALALEATARGDLQRHALRVGASTTIGNYVLPDLLARFHGCHDEVADAAQWQSEVRIANTGDICAAVARFELDIGIIEGPNHEPSLRSMPWLRDEMVIVSSPHDAFASKQGPLTGAELREATWLLREPGSGTREVADAMLLPHLGDYQRVRVLASSEAIKRAAAARLGLACLSRWVVGEMLADGRLRALATVVPRFHRQCFVVLHRSKGTTPALAELLSVLEHAAGAAVGAPAG